MIDLWLILIIIPPFIWALANFYDKVLVSKLFSSVYSFLFFSNLFIPFAILILILFNMYEIFSFIHILILMSMGFIFLASFILYAKALELEESSKVGSLFVFVTIFILIIEFLMLDVSLTLLQYISSFLIIIFSLIMINSSQLTSIFSIFKFNKVFLFMILNTLIIAFYFTLMKYFLELYSLFGILFWIFVGELIFLILLLLNSNSRKEIITSGKRISSRYIFIFLITVVNILTVLPDIVYNYVISIAPSVALVSVVANIQYIFLFIFGILFTKLFPSFIYENIELKQLIIKAICVIGIVGGVILIQL
ncbi:MAG: EamA family transporter [Nanoarchaeota archaeon]|nr:EamA family transporter [Nanoarchaeota archaeon]